VQKLHDPVLSGPINIPLLPEIPVEVPLIYAAGIDQQLKAALIEANN